MMIKDNTLTTYLSLSIVRVILIWLLATYITLVENRVVNLEQRIIAMEKLPWLTDEETKTLKQWTKSDVMVEMGKPHRAGAF